MQHDTQGCCCCSCLFSKCQLLQSESLARLKSWRLLLLPQLISLLKGTNCRSCWEYVGRVSPGCQGGDRGQGWCVWGPWACGGVRALFPWHGGRCDSHCAQQTHGFPGTPAPPYCTPCAPTAHYFKFSCKTTLIFPKTISSTSQLGQSSILLCFGGLIPDPFLEGMCTPT